MMKPIEFRGKETMSYNKTEQPTAEGAEEILEDIAMRIDASGVGNNRDAIKRFYRDKLNTLATLHAQRIADKMVAEKCKKCKYRGLPDSINEALNSGDGVYRP